MAKGPPPEHLVVHRELEYLRAAAMKGSNSKAAKRARVRNRYKKLQEVKRDN